MEHDLGVSGSWFLCVSDLRSGVGLFPRGMRPLGVRIWDSGHCWLQVCGSSWVCLVWMLNADWAEKMICTYIISHFHSS